MKSLNIARIFHKRHSPRCNEFSYNGFYIKFSLEQIDKLNSRLFSVDKFNLFSFYSKDHGARDGSDLKQWALEQLKSAGIKNFKGSIILQTFPRVLGYVFNPVSFWYFEEKGELKYVLCEVNNTFGESHVYVLKDDPKRNIITLPKQFHVSPFYDREGEYRFDFRKKDKVFINYYIDNELALNTYIVGDAIEFNDSNILKLFFRFPLYTMMVVALIHYQALRLFIKKIRYFRKPKKYKFSLTS